MEDTWLPRLVDMAHPHCLEADRRFAAFVLSDVFEFGLVSPGHGAALGVPELQRAQQLAAEQLLPALLALASVASDDDAADTSARRQVRLNQSRVFL